MFLETSYGQTSFLYLKLFNKVTVSTHRLGGSSENPELIPTPKVKILFRILIGAILVSGILIQFVIALKNAVSLHSTPSPIIFFHLAYLGAGSLSLGIVIDLYLKRKEVAELFKAMLGFERRYNSN